MQVQVFPPEVCFRAVSKGVVHSTLIAIKNVDTRARIIKISHPATSAFKLIGYQPSLKLAPGLETALEVRFQADASDRDYEDQLTIVTETESIVVPLRAFRPLPKLVVKEGADLDLGVVVDGARVEAAVIVANAGEAPLKFNVGELGDNLAVEPDQGTLQPGEEAALNVAFAAETLGDFETAAQIKYTRAPEIETGASEITDAGAGGAFPDFESTFHLKGSVVSHTIELLSAKKGQLPSPIDLGTKYYGDYATKQCVLVNKGPKAVKFVSYVGSASDMSAFSSQPDGSPEELASKITPSSTFVLQPRSGVIPAYSEMNVKIVFHPERVNEIKGYAAAQKAVGSVDSFDFVSIIDFKGMPSKRISLPLLGKATMLSLDLSPSMLSFSEIQVHDYLDAVIEARNLNDLLPLQFKVRNTPNFKVHPIKGVLGPGDKMSMKVSFVPRTLGNHRERVAIEMVSQKGLVMSSQHLTLVGRASGIGVKATLVGGPDRVPEDFRKKEKYVEQDADRNIIGSTIHAGSMKGSTMFGARALDERPLDITVKRDKYEIYKKFLKSERQRRKAREAWT